MKTYLSKIANSRAAIAIGGVSGIVGIFAFALLAQAAPAVNIVSTIQNGSNATVTSAAIGSLVHNSVSVASTTGPIASGTVNFNRYQNTTCSGTATVESGVVLSSGVAQSANVTMPNTGLSYTVHYNGSDIYPSSDAECKSVVATASNTTLSLALSTTTAVYAGSSINASATLGNMTSNAGGSVAYTVYNNNSCTTAVTGGGVVSVTNGVVPNSNSVQFNTPGTYYFQGVYGGNADNSPATSTCSAAVVTVLSTSTSNTAPTISLIGANPFNIVVGQTFTDPGATASDSQQGNLTANIVKTGSVNTGVVGTTVLTYTVADSGGLYATTTRTVVVSATTTTGQGRIAGNVYNDANKSLSKDSGEANLAGWTINLYKGAGWWGRKHNNAPFQTAVTDSSGNYSFNNLADGTYSIEEINQKDWRQLTSDFRSVVIVNGSAKLDANFANVEKVAPHKDNKDNKKLIKHFKNVFDKFVKQEKKQDR